MNDDLIERLNDPHRRLTVSDRQEAAIEIAKLREWQRARLETDDALRALSPPEPTERQIERAVDLAMSWQPSERGLSYAERRREVMGLLVPALRAMPLQDHGWQDISTAPKDGTWVLGFERGINTKYAPHEVMRYGSRLGKECWFNSSDHAVPNASHWMPLAPSPAMVAEEGTKP